MLLNLEKYCPNFDNHTFIPSSHKYISYMGRNAHSEDSSVLYYAGSSITVRFSGTSVKALIRSKHECWRNFIGYIVDGKKDEKIEITKDNEIICIDIADSLSDEIHDLVIFKRMDACHSLEFFGLFLDKNAQLYAPPQKPARRIECFGDSVSAGEVCEALDYIGKQDPIHEGQFSNSWYSYALITARKLNAQIHNNSQGGISLLDKTGYFHGPDTLGLLSTYDKLCYNPNLGEVTLWDFSQYIPHIVIIAIGQNDAHPDNYINTNLEKRTYWKEHYKGLILNLRKHYPKAMFILTTTILCHDKGWDDCIEEAKNELADKKIHHFLYTRNGNGTPGHIRIPEAEEMAYELSAYINSLGNDIWND